MMHLPRVTGIAAFSLHPMTPANTGAAVWYQGFSYKPLIPPASSWQHTAPPREKQRARWVSVGGHLDERRESLQRGALSDA
jgi:hypothetical protein